MKKNKQSFNNNMVGSKKKVSDSTTKKQNSKVGYNLTDTDEPLIDNSTDSSITDCK